MKQRIVLAILGCAALWGCASTGGPGPHAPHTAAEATRPIGSEELGDFRAGVDSAVALFDFGDVAEFLAVRDSLIRSLDLIARYYPAIRSEPEFTQIMKGLGDLDSLDIVRAYAHRHVVEMDSLALSVQPWPELDTLEVAEAETVPDDTVFPVLSNDRIDFWIRYFTGPGRERFERYMYRMALHRPVIESILKEQGLPTELIVIPMIESGFYMKARSRARAVGPWQFIAGTARIYGLRVNWWFDERRDVVASTYAASNYLKDLYSIWESWPLALAAYNCGEYRVARAVARQKTRNFWKLRLPKQTERYVPKFLAALYIVRNPEKYGFVRPDVEPIRFDEVKVTDATDLKLIARSAGSSVDVLRELNPALLRWTTPPKTEMLVKVPDSTGTACSRKLAAVPPSERVTWRKHRIRKGETLSTIAGRYGTSISALKRLNGIRNAHRIRAGRYLVVPLQGPRGEVASTKPQYKTKRRKLNKAALERYAKKHAPPANHKRVVYRVKDRDTLGEIAEVFHTSARRIRRWNNLSYRSYIYPGQKLVIYVPKGADVSKLPAAGRHPTGRDYVKRTYTVKKGDTIYSISRRFSVSMSDVLAWNNKTTRSKIYPGQVLEIWTKKTAD